MVMIGFSGRRGERKRSWERGTMEAREMVTKLQSKPFNYVTSLSHFDEKRGEELLQLVGQVLAQLFPEHAGDTKRETVKQTADRVLDFLRITKYHHGMDEQRFEAAVLEGRPKVLPWATASAEKLKKQAFVAYNLAQVHMPTEHLQDKEIVQLHQQTQELQREFV